MSFNSASDKTYTLGNLHPQHWEENEKSTIVLFIYVIKKKTR
jgi:hypothetical protein